MELPEGVEWPEWADYFAIDGDGEQFFYEVEPYWEGDRWVNSDNTKRYDQVFPTYTRNSLLKKSKEEPDER